ncbi:DUF1295 domain-containing protein [Candidatus Dojkabacteria bacterium]|nr:DUF1295 domain-containing protein [Candidatus Dojkabacteria bacterium]
MEVLEFDTYNILFTLGVSFAIQIGFFSLAAYFKTDKVTDLSYGLTFVIIAWILFLLGDTRTTPQLVLSLMVTAWGIRLAGYLFIRILKIKKDKRFDGIRENFWKFASFWTLQGTSIWLILIPTTVFLSSSSTENFEILNLVGLKIWAIGLIAETIADWQKFQFKNNPANKGKWIQSGLWAHSRHPNYFGELLCWWGIFVYVLPILNYFLFLSLIGPLTITTLILFISGIPTIEKKYDERYKDNPEYQKYKESTHVIIPFL